MKKPLLGTITENKPYADLVEATHRIDERALRHLLPIVKIEDLREKCGSWFGVAFPARQVTCTGNMFERLSSFEVSGRGIKDLPLTRKSSWKTYSVLFENSSFESCDY